MIPDVAAPDPAYELGVVERRVERVAGDVRDLGRQLGSARRENDSPPNIRWSTNRSSTVVRRRAEADPQVPLVGGAGRLDEHLAAHAEVGEQGVAGVERRARGTCRGGGRR